MEKLIYAVNAIILFLIVQYEYNSDNDKTTIISSIAFMALLGFNLLFGLSAQLDKKSFHRHFYYAALGLLVSVLVLIFLW